MLFFPEKAIQLHARKGQCKRELQFTSTTTTTTTPKPVAVNTDDCFLELPNYVLEGNALAVETNVSVDECKCFCVDAERRYGTDCQSLEYYYDEKTCLLSKENRISNPSNFNYDAHGSSHSYFDFRCQAEKLTLAVYVEQICSKVIDLKISDIHPTTDTSLDVDEKEERDKDHENEVRLVTQTQLPLNSHNDDHTTPRVKILKFINESEDDSDVEPSYASSKERQKPRKKSKLRQKSSKSESSEHILSATQRFSEAPTTTFKPTTQRTTKGLEKLSSAEKNDKRPKHEFSTERHLAEIEELEGEEEDLKKFQATSTTEA